jgi:thioredoxin-related protein
MKKSGLLLFCALVVVVIVSSCSSKYKTPEDIKGYIAWLDARQALPLFPFGTNPIYMIVYSDKSHNCLKMDDNIFSRPEIIEYVNEHITCIKLIPDSIESVVFLGQQYSIGGLLDTLDATGYPTHYFFNFKGELKGIRDGYINLHDFKQLVKYIGEGYFEKIDFATFLSRTVSEVDTVWGEF